MNTTEKKIHYTTLNCQQCKKEYQARYKDRNIRKYCTKECSRLALLDIFRKSPNRIGFKKGNKNIAWKGGVYLNSEAYIPHSITARERLVDRPKPNNCEICNKIDREICFDHDHKTGKFRGWLCHTCNRTLGNVYDNVEILKKMVVYLERNGTRK